MQVCEPESLIYHSHTHSHTIWEMLTSGLMIQTCDLDLCVQVCDQEGPVLPALREPGSYLRLRHDCAPVGYRCSRRLPAQGLYPWNPSPMTPITRTSNCMISILALMLVPKRNMITRKIRG